MKTQATLAELLQAFFTEWLMGQRNASPHTIANYRDTFRLLLAFGCRGRGLKKTPAALSVQDLDAPLPIGRYTLPPIRTTTRNVNVWPCCF